MLYVQQSLGPNEEILMGARFHWMYTLQAIFWILFGLAMGVLLGYASVWMTVSHEIRVTYGPGLKGDDYQIAWTYIVNKHGGYLKILWEQNFLVRFGILGLFLLGLYFFAHMMIVKATTEIAVTSERLIYKKGLIARHVGELNIDRIEGVSVRQDVMGRMFGFGRVCIRGMGVGEVLLPPIESPIEFRKAIGEAQAMQEKTQTGRRDDDI
ncbi:MAG: PH domain-containing protein [Alphaproteobacteria bacterium]|nr:PH domain-containing protein [Alphaproteobacteria bacterium]